ncbi:MAG: hypothetical protein AAF611_12195 [Bacteroidota bacterium]
MKKKKVNKLKLNASKVSNLMAHSILGGETCESPCQGGTDCCNPGGGDDNTDFPKYNNLLYFLYSMKFNCFD